MNPGDFEFFSSETSLNEGCLGDVLQVFVSDFTLRQNAGEAKVREVERKMGGVTSELFILRKLLQDFQTRVNDDHELIMRLQHEIEALRGRVRSLDSKHAAVEVQSGRLDLRIEQLREQLSQSCEDTNQNVSRLISNFARTNLSRNNTRRDSANNNNNDTNRRELTQNLCVENAEPSSEYRTFPQENTQCNSSETEPSLGNSLVPECSITQVGTAFPNKTTKEVTNEEFLANDKHATINDAQAEPQPHSLCDESISREKEGMHDTQETLPENSSLIIGNNQEQLQVTDLKLSSGAISECSHVNSEKNSGEVVTISSCSHQNDTSKENSRKQTTSDANDDTDSISQQVDTEQVNLMNNGINDMVRTEEKISLSPHFSKSTENKLGGTAHQLPHTEASPVPIPNECINPLTPEEAPKASCSVASQPTSEKSQGLTKKNKSRKYRGRKRKDSQNTDCQQSPEETERHPPTQTNTESISLANSEAQLSSEGTEKISIEGYENVSAECIIEKSTVDEEQISVEIQEHASAESQGVLGECEEQVSATSKELKAAYIEQVSEENQEVLAECVEQVSESQHQIHVSSENKEASAEYTERVLAESQQEILISANLESCLSVEVTQTDQGEESLSSSMQENENSDPSKNEDNCQNDIEITSKNEQFSETKQENPSQEELMNSVPTDESCFSEEDRNTKENLDTNLSIHDDKLTEKNEKSQQPKIEEQLESFPMEQMNTEERGAQRKLNISEEKSSPLSKRRVISKTEMDDEEMPDLSDADNLMEDMQKLKEKSTEQRKTIEIKTPSGEITDLQPKKTMKREEKRMETKEEEPKDEVVGMCANCSNLAKLRCGNCRQAFYCKKECQKEHWKTIHKDQCRPFQILESPELGRYMTASRDLKAGDVILKEEPLVVGPKQITEPICLGCYKRVDGSYRCQKCHWPMCGPQCEKSPDHLPECVVGMEIGSPIEIANFDDPNHFYEVVFPLRCLALKKKSPKKYEQLISLDSHYEDRKGTHVHIENQKSIVNMLRNYFLLQQFPIEDIDSSEKSIHNITGIIDVNALEIRMQETEILGLYPNFAMLEHSCTPNTKHSFTDGRQVVLKAAVDIKRGEHLSTMYTHILWGTLARRDHLKHSKYFMCTCFRCSDPTELGTNFSTIRCKQCTNGFMLSAAPLDELADWLCTSCNETIKNEEVTEINLKLGEEVEKVLAAPTVPLLEDLLQNQAKTTVHPNHYHLFSLRHTLLQMYGRDPSCANEEYMKKKERMCQDFLKVCTALDPGMARLAPYAGVALYEYHLAVLSRTRQDPGAHQTDPAALKKDVETAKALLQQCIRVLQEEPKDQPEGQLCQVAQQNLIELKQWEASLFST